MRKLFYFFAIFMSLCTGAIAQIAFQENFDAVPDGGIPSGWTRFNIDGLTPFSTVSWVNDAWVCYAEPAFLITSKCAWSTSYYSVPGTSNDWMFTPAVSIPASNAVLQYLVTAENPDWPDGYEVRVSTVVPSAGNLMNSAIVYSTATAEGTPTTKTIKLDAYSGQTVYIGWRNNSTDRFLLAVDDVVVKTLPDNDAALVSINTPNILLPGNAGISGTIKNMGFDTISSFKVTYTIDGGASSPDYYVTGQHIATGASGTFTHNVPVNFTPGEHMIQVTISDVNGLTDPNPGDNVLSKTISVAAQTVAMMPLFEGFSSSTCSTCAEFDTVIFNSWAVLNDANMNYIKYQVNWPGNGDPYYIPLAGQRADYYDCTSVPDFYFNGSQIVTTVTGLNNALAQAGSESAVFSISCNPTYFGKMVSVPVTINPYVTVTGLKVYVVITERITTGNVGTNGETSWHHVMMQMLPSASGTSVDFTSGTPYVHTFTGNMAGSFVENMNDLIAFVFIEDDAARNVLQSASSSIVTGINEIPVNSVKILPNPATDNIKIVNAADANIMLYDIFGKLLMSDTKISSDYLMNVSSLPNGTYILRVYKEEKAVCLKVAIVR